MESPRSKSRIKKLVIQYRCKGIFTRGRRLKTSLLTATIVKSRIVKDGHKSPLYIKKGLI